MYLLMFSDLETYGDPGSLMFRTGSELDGMCTPDTTISDKVNPPSGPIIIGHTNGHVINGKTINGHVGKKEIKTPRSTRTPRGKARDEKAKKNQQNEKSKKDKKTKDKENKEKEKPEKKDPNYKGSLLVTGIQ